MKAITGCLKLVIGGSLALFAVVVLLALVGTVIRTGNTKPVITQQSSQTRSGIESTKAARLVSPYGEVGIYRNDDAINRVFSASNSSDLNRLRKSGDLMMCRSGTRVRIVKDGDPYCQIVVLDGPLAGRRGLVEKTSVSE